MRVGVGDHGVEGDLRPGAAGRRQADERRQVVRDVVLAGEGGDRPVAGHLDPGALGAVHRAAAAEPDDPVAAVLPVQGRRLGHVGGRRVRLRLRVHGHPEAGVTYVAGDPVDDAGAGDTAVGDEQRPADAKLAEAPADLTRDAATVEDPRRALEDVNAVPHHQTAPAPSCPSA